LSDASHANGNAQAASTIQTIGAHTPSSGKTTEVGGSYYVQWVKHSDVERRCAEGWHVAGGLCRHNMYAVLMRAPEGWEP
jgi:hypothetical protein